jgi:hypothetical protein
VIQSVDAVVLGVAIDDLRQVLPTPGESRPSP